MLGPWEADSWCGPTARALGEGPCSTRVVGMNIHASCPPRAALLARRKPDAPQEGHGLGWLSVLPGSAVSSQTRHAGWESRSKSGSEGEAAGITRTPESPGQHKCPVPLPGKPVHPQGQEGDKRSQKVGECPWGGRAPEHTQVPEVSACTGSPPPSPSRPRPPLRPAQGCSVRRLGLAPSGTAVWERDYGVSDVKFSCQSFQHVV